MNYQVWTKDEYGETYTKVECGDMEAVKRELENSLKRGNEPVLTMEVPYTMNIKIMEVGSEAIKSKAKPDKGTRDPSDGKVRRGDEGAAQEVGKGSGDPGTNPGAEN